MTRAALANQILEGKYRGLEARLQGLGCVLIGFSGGVDSTLLTAVARETLGRDRVTACLAVGPSLPEQERREAVRLARLLDVELKTYPAREFENPAYLANGPDRCFHCKADLFRHLRHFAETFAAPGSGPALLYGGNLDDTLDYRPGRKAADAFGALAPLAESGFTKADVRALSRALGLPTADKAAQPCLSSRIPYGSAVTPAKLAVVEAGEAELAALGFREYRLRHYGKTARVEVPVDQLGIFTDDKREALALRFRALGFTDLEIDPAGFRSGNLNRSLSPESLSRYADNARDPRLDQP